MKTLGFVKIHKKCFSNFVKTTLENMEKAKKKDWAKIKQEHKKTSDLTLTQTTFNKFIRLRDQKKGCVSCGRPVKMGEKNYSAGHYYTRGARSDLRFNEDNVWGQCNKDNVFPGVNTMANFKKEVIKRIGKERFKALSVRKKQDYSPKKLKEIRSYYSVRIKKLIKN